MPKIKYRPFSYQAEYDFSSHSILVDAKSMQTWEKRCFSQNSARSLAMMELAAAKISQYLLRAYPEQERYIVVCGAGNNAGDGYAVARYLSGAAKKVEVFALRAGATLSSDARDMWLRANEVGIEIRELIDEASYEALATALSLRPQAFVVDAILGTGLDRAVDGLWKRCIDLLNAQDLCIASVDLPSGIGADDGKVWGAAIKASLTFTLGAPKQGLFISQGPEYSGNIMAIDLSLGPPPENLARKLLLSDMWAKNLVLKPRRLSTHKAECGHALLIGGGKGMAGAINISAHAALRSGAGLVTAAFLDEGSTILPEIMSVQLQSSVLSKDFDKAIERADVIACGPGLGRTAQSTAVLEKLRSYTGVLVLDADALWTLAKSEINFSAKLTVLTPHIGEAALLLKCSTRELLDDVLAAACKIAKRYQVFTVLKAHSTIIACPNGDFAISAKPTPFLAGPGFGDALTGMIAAHIASSQIDGIDYHDAICLAVYHHAHAGLRAAALHGKATTATDLINSLCIEQS
ncbi:MAG: NAD(P)H-hydrate dehydratase [Bradymonadia bacterium]